MRESAFSTPPRVGETAQTIPRSVELIDVCLKTSSNSIEHVVTGASTNTLSAMENVLRVTALVEDMTASVMT